MPMYAAFLRGVSPMNCRMADLTAAVQAAGFDGVRTVLSSGNVVFAGKGSQDALARKLEAAMPAHLGRTFLTIVRPVAHLEALLEADPFAAHRLPAGAKRIVTFLAAKPAAVPKLPLAREGARILALQGLDAFGFYVPSPKGAAFMGVIEGQFGPNVTTRTWDTVRKVCAAAAKE